MMLRKLTNEEGAAMNVDNTTDDEFINGKDQPAHKHQNNQADIPHTLKAEANQ